MVLQSPWRKNHKSKTAHLKGGRYEGNSSVVSAIDITQSMNDTGRVRAIFRGAGLRFIF